MIPRQGDRDARASSTGLAVVAGFLENQPAAVAMMAGWARQVARNKAWGFDSPEDIVQATLLTLVTLLREGRFSGGNLRAYVQRIAKNICVSSYRRAQVRRGMVSLEHEVEVQAHDAGGYEHDLDGDLTLQAILGRLDAVCRRIIEMAYVHGLDRREIAQRLDITVGAARVKLFRCLQRARTLADRREE
jgi:RNA polymerase sigma factor (sigma-70 family)